MRVGVSSWAAVTRFGDLESTWANLHRGASIDHHARIDLPVERSRGAHLALSTGGRCAFGKLDPDAAVIVGTSKGAVEDWLIPPTSDNPGGGLRPCGLGSIASELSHSLRTRGPVLTVSAACASGLHALIRGAMMIQSGEVRQALIVAAEASVHPLFLGSFERLGVLARPGEGCRPFDRNRTGFYMSEAACAVLLESADDGTTAPLYVERFALGGDATHLTGGDPQGRVLRKLLARVVDGRPVDLIHAHGTGTEMNDATELAAIEAMVCDQPGPPVAYSHKAALGHSLGASGLLSVVINCMCHTTGQVPPNIRTTDPLPTHRVVIPRTVTERPVRRSLALAAGFGGPLAVVALASA